MKFSWGMTTDKKNIILLVESISPIELTFSILFEIEKYYAVIDEILRSQMLIIQGGKPDDWFSYNLNSNKIVVEVSLTGFEEKWNNVRKKYQGKRLKKMGMQVNFQIFLRRLWHIEVKLKIKNELMQKLKEDDLMMG